MAGSTASVLYLTHDGLTDPLGESQIIPYLIQLSAKGFSITVISLEKIARKYNRYQIVKQQLEEANISWVPLDYADSIPVISQFMNYKKLLKVSRKRACKVKFQLVHCRSYLAGLCGMKLKHEYGLKFLFDIRGFWADERIDGEIWNMNNPVHNVLYKFFKKAERRLFRTADHVISLTKEAKRYIIRHFGVPEDSITVIPCCADDAVFHLSINPEAIGTLAKEFKSSSSDFILGYAGSLGTWYMVHEMVEFFEQLHQLKPGSKFYIASNDPCPSWLQDHPLYGNKIILKTLTRDQMPAFYSLLDASVYFIKPTFSKLASSPTKLAELMIMGIPVVVNKGIGDQDQIIADSKGGVIIENMDEKSFKHTANQLIELITLFNKQNVIRYAKENFALRIGIENYTQVYKKLTVAVGSK